MTERTGVVTFAGNPMTLLGDEVKVGDKAKDFSALKPDMSEFKLSDTLGKVVVLTAFPSVDTGVCALQTKRFNQEAGSLGDNVAIVTISADLPFALGRFCAAEGIDKVESLSDFRGSFGEDYGVTLTDGPLKGLLSRAVIVADENNKVLYTEQVPEIVQEPNYESALDALK